MITAIMQNRIASTRLPGKALLTFKGKTSMEHIVDRLRKSRHVNKILVATTINPEDIKIIELCKKIDVQCYQGSVNDVLDRYKVGIGLTDATHILRITADCPIIDYSIVDKVIDLHLKEDADLTSNAITETFPDGYDCEIVKASVLYDAWKYAIKLTDREHVTTYIKDNYIKYKIREMICPDNLNHLRFTLDEKEDYELLTIVFNELYDKNNYFGLGEVLDLIRRRPEIVKINKNIIRNEGLMISKRNEGLI